MRDSLVTSLLRFLEELRRRRMFRVATLYAVVALASMEIAANVVEGLGLSPALRTTVVVIAVLGFPIALGLGWFFDLTPEGLTKTLPREHGAAEAPAEAFLTPASWAIIVPALAVIGVLMFWSPLAPDLPTPTELAASGYLESVAVMPLEDGTDREDLAGVGVNVAQSIIAQLQQIRPLKTIDIHSVRAAADDGMTVSELARRLQVRHVIRGAMLVDGTRLRFWIQHLASASPRASWEEAWASEWTTSLTDPGAAVERVAKEATVRILEQMPQIQPPDSLDQLRTGPGDDAYQLGKYWLGRRTPEGLGRAIANFREAIVLDPTNAAAYADLASTYALVLTYRYDIGLDAYDLAARSLALAQRALQLNPDEYRGYAARGYLGAIINAPPEGVFRDFRRATQLQPNAASVASWSARSLEMSGRPEEALQQATRAAALDPLAAGRHIAVAYLSLSLGRFDQAIDAARHASELEPGLALSKAIEGRSLLLGGRASECVELDLGPHDVLEATCLWELGERDRAQRIVLAVADRVESGRVNGSGFTAVLDMEDLAIFYAWIGDAEAALRWTRRAFDSSPSGIDVRMYRSRLFERVRSEEFGRAVDGIRADLFASVIRAAI